MVSDSFLEQCFKALRADGGRLTISRTAIVEILDESNKAMTAHDIFTCLESRSIRVDLATIYRCLHQLQEQGLIHSVDGGKTLIACKHQSCKTQLHVLTHCESCHRVEENHLSGSVFDEVWRQVMKRQSFSPRQHFFQINGLCNECRS